MRFICQIQVVHILRCPNLHRPPANINVSENNDLAFIFNTTSEFLLNNLENKLISLILIFIRAILWGPMATIMSKLH